MNFKFDGNMSRDVLESYLSRAVTASGLYESDTLDDDLRVIARMGVKFIGRASGHLVYAGGRLSATLSALRRWPRACMSRTPR